MYDQELRGQKPRADPTESTDSDIIIAPDGGEVLEKSREGVLPFVHPDTETPDGKTVTIVAIGRHREIRKHAGNRVNSGCCRRCGYDRAKVVTHSEVDAGVAECHACGAKLAEWF